MKEQIKTLAVKVLGMTDAEAQLLFKKTDAGEDLVEDFADILAKKDRERIERINESHKVQLTDVHDKGYKKAQKEALSNFEKQVKEKYGYETDKMGLDLVDDLVQLNKSASSQDIKNHPDFIKLERKLESEFIPKTKFDETLTEFESFKKNVEREKVIGKVKEDARKVFRSLNPLLSKDPKRAANQESEFLAKLDGFDYQVNEDGNHVILRNGNRLENENYNPVAFNDFIKSKASDLFDFAEQRPTGNSGVNTSNSQTEGNYAFQSKDEFMKKYNSETDPAVRVKMHKAATEQKIL